MILEKENQLSYYAGSGMATDGIILYYFHLCVLNFHMNVKLGNYQIN